MLVSQHQQILSSDGAGLDFNRYEVSNFSGYEYQNLNYVVILGVKFNGFSDNFAGYFMKIYYNSTLIFDTGNSTDTENGNPINWPPPQNAYGTETIGPGNRQVKSPELVPFTNNEGAPFKHYILPDVHYELIKNGININGNTTIENQIQAGSHFALGSYRSTIKIDEDGAEPTLKSYYGITKLSSPPFIYRNTVAVDDGGVSSGSDEDFNDAVFTLIEGDGFFKGGKTVKSDALLEGLSDKDYAYSGQGAGDQTWSKSTITFVANETGTFKFEVRREASSADKILLHPGSGTPNAGYFATIEPSDNNSQVTRTLNTLQSGTYEVALRVNNNESNNSRIQVRHIDINNYPTMFGS